MSAKTRPLLLHSRREFALCAVAIGLLALFLRLTYSSSAMVPAPIGGDATQYVAYAWNMLHHGVFANAIPGSGTPVVPDAYRGPGYPAFLYLALWASRDGEGWYPLVLQIQAVLGALTAVLSLWIGRRFLSPALAISAGLLTAAWPHLLSASGYLLSETLFGFLALGAIAASIAVIDAPTPVKLAAAGISSGLASLVNPVFTLFPVLVALLVRRQRSLRPAVQFLALAMLLPVAWELRGMLVLPGGQPSRLAQNFVQGSWPLYHAAYNSRNAAEEPREILQAIGAEELLLESAPSVGLRAMSRRVLERPLHYASWYLLEKPYLLWSWDIRIGQGDIYVLPTTKSPFETRPSWSAAKAAFKLLNPVLFWLAMLSALAAARHLRWNEAGESSAHLVLAGFFAYVTALHVVLQAEPRYAIPYRPIEILLAVAAFGIAVDWARRARPLAHG